MLTFHYGKSNGKVEAMCTETLISSVDAGSGAVQDSDLASDSYAETEDIDNPFDIVVWRCNRSKCTQANCKRLLTFAGVKVW